MQKKKKKKSVTSKNQESIEKLFFFMNTNSVSIWNGFGAFSYKLQIKTTKKKTAHG